MCMPQQGFEMKTSFSLYNKCYSFYFQCCSSHCLIRNYSFLAGSPGSITNCDRESRTVAKSFELTQKLMLVVTSSVSSSWISSDFSSPAPSLR